MNLKNLYLLIMVITCMGFCSIQPQLVKYYISIMFVGIVALWLGEDSDKLS